MLVEPQQEHNWLEQLVGEWTSESEMLTDPEQPPLKGTGSESVRSIGGFWVAAEGQGEWSGCGAVTTILTVGYDPSRGRYIGTWVGSMMSHLWVYDGALNATGTELTLEAEGPSMAGEGKLAKYRDVIEIKSADHRTLTSYMLGDDGQWHQFMTAHYRRK